MNEILLIRHGATAGNLQKRYIGRTDEPLCPEGIAQGKALGELRLRADRLFVSPLLRTRQTAELAFPGMEQTLVGDLRETDFGVFEGRSADEMAQDPAYRAWVDSWCRDPIPGGEDVEGFHARARAAFAAAVETLSPGETAAFVVHGGVIMAILAEYARPKGEFYDYHLPNGGLCRCRWENGILTVL